VRLPLVVCQILNGAGASPAQQLSKSLHSLHWRSQCHPTPSTLIAVVELQWFADKGLTKIAELAIPPGGMQRRS